MAFLKKPKKLGLNTDKLGYDGYYLKVTDKYIVIAGNDKPMITEPISGHVFIYGCRRRKIYMMGEQGTMRGVYKFLEKYAGIRFYMPTDLGTVIPKSPDFTIPSVETYVTPAFRGRNFYAFWFEGASDDALYWHHRLCAGGLRNPSNHNFRSMLKYKKTNPEFFALIAGKRDFTNLSTANNFGNLCMTNRGCIKAFAKLAQQYFDKNPDMDIFPCVPQDGLYRICECKDCKKLHTPDRRESGLFSKAVFYFAGEVAKELKKTHPTKKLGVLAYARYRDLPDVELPDNLVVMICYSRQSMLKPKTKALVEKTVKDYASKKVPITVWTYPLFNHRPPLRGIPVFYPHLLKDNLMFNKANGVIGEFSEASYRSGGGDQLVKKRGGDIAMIASTHINDYVRCQLLWDPTQDVDAMLEEYYTLFYGPAAAEMKKFWEVAEQRFKERTESTVYTAKDIKEFQAMIKAALAKTTKDTVYYKRIDLLDKELAPFFKTMLLVRSASNSLGVTLVNEDIPAAYDANTIWKYASERTLTLKGGNTAPKSSRTKLYAIANEKALSLHLEAKEPQISKLVKNAKVHDDNNAWLDDCYEIFICAKDRSFNFQYVVTAGGILYDRKLYYDRHVSDLSWKSNFSVKQWEKGQVRYSTITIPWSDFGKPFAEMPEILIQIFRRQTNGSKTSGTYHVIFPSLGFHNYSPEYFGAINLLPLRDAVQNPSFEKVTSKGKSANWEGSGKVVTGDATDGQKSVALNNSSLYSSYIPVTEDTNYSFFFDHKGEAGYGYTLFYNDKGKRVTEPNRVFFWAGGSKKWKTVGCFGRVPAGATKVRVMVRNFSKKKSSCFDNIKFFGGKKFRYEKNLIRNGSFEELKGKHAAGWTTGCKIISGGAADGKNYLRVAVKDGDFTQSDAFAVTAGKKFVFSAKNRGDAGFVYLMFEDAAGKKLKSNKHYWQKPYADWEKIMITGIVPADAKKCRIGLRNFSMAKEKVGSLFDDVSFVEE